MALAAGALHPEAAAVVANVPFLCYLERAPTLTDAGPYQEVVS
jgi:cephalosporin-C deacetylase